MGSHLACTFHVVCLVFFLRWVLNTNIVSGGIQADMALMPFHSKCHIVNMFL